MDQQQITMVRKIGGELVERSFPIHKREIRLIQGWQVKGAPEPRPSRPEEKPDEE